MRFLMDPASVHLDAVGWLFLLVIVVLLPLGALRQQWLLGGRALQVSRARIYTNAIATHAIFLLMTLAVISSERLDLFPLYRLTPLHAAIGLVALALGLLPIIERFRLDDPVATARTRLIAPRTRGEFAFFYAVSASAGVAEELTYRGLLFTLLTAITGGWWVPAIIAAAVFGIVHLFQGWKSAGIAGLIGLREQIVVGLTGTLFVAIVVHALHDAIAGTVIGLRARREEITGAIGAAEHSTGAAGAADNRS